MLKCLDVKIKERGVSLYLALIIMTVLLAIALGLTAISVSQIKTIREMGYSVTAFYAADTGIERLLYEDKMCRLPNCSGLGCVDETLCDKGRSAAGGSVSGNLTNGASYKVTFDDGATTIKSVGTYQKTKRAIQTTR